MSRQDGGVRPYGAGASGVRPPAVACSGSTVRNPWLPHAARIVEVTDEAPGVKTYRLRFTDAEAASKYVCGPGQFNMLYVPGYGESAISVSRIATDGGDLLHTIRTAGDVTRKIESLPVGGTLGLRGPFGSQWPLESSAGRDVVLVAGGIGLAPLRPVIDDLVARRERYDRATLIYGARSPELLLYRREYAAWRAAGVNVLETVDRADEGWSGAIGVVTLLLDRLRPLRPERTTVMICGPETMMQFSLASAVRRGVAPSDVWLSMERNMQCAVGLCGHCQFGPEFICKDGPVFAAERIASLLRVVHL